MDSLINDITINDKVKYLKIVKANLLARAYIHTLISNLYIKLPNHSGYANEVVKDELLADYASEATASMIPFFKEKDLIIRGLIVDDWNKYFNHSWIEFNLHNKAYIFDPSLNITTSKQNYEGIFLPQKLGSVSSYQVKNDVLNTLATGKENEFGFITINKSNDINSSFYKTDMQIKGETLNHKILTLTTYYK